MHERSTGPLKPVKWYKELAAKQARIEAGAFLVEGMRAISQVAVSSPDAILEILSTGMPPSQLGRYPFRQLTPAQLKSISSSQSPHETIAVVKFPPETFSETLPEDAGRRVLLLEDVQDPGNTGTLIRTAAAFGYSGVILTDKCADPFAPKCVQSSAGAVLSIWIRRTSQYFRLAGELKGRGYRLAAMDLRGHENLSALQSIDNLVLVLGNEGAGLSKELLALADQRLKIPVITEKAESLNVAACGAICMYLSKLPA